MGKLDNRAHYYVVLHQQLSKYPEFAKHTDILNELREGRHGNAFEAVMQTIEILVREAEWGK
jgi:hypothetical protein